MYRFEVSGTSVECDTADELRAALNGHSSTSEAAAEAPATLPMADESEAEGDRRSESWEVARRLKRPNETVSQARSRLARQRRKRA